MPLDIARELLLVRTRLTRMWLKYGRSAPELLSVEEAAERLSVGVAAIQHMLRVGEIGLVYCRGKGRISSWELDDAAARAKERK